MEVVSRESYDHEYELRKAFDLQLFTCRVRIKDVIEMLEPYVTDKLRDEKVDLTVGDLQTIIDEISGATRDFSHELAAKTEI